MDEIMLFRQLRPQDAPDADQMGAAVRERLLREISPRGRSGRRPGWFSRRPLVLTAAVAAAVGIAVLVPVMLPGDTAGPFAARAWAVQRNDDGTVTVTINQAHDPAGLQRMLRADGVRAYVRYSPWVVKSSNGSTTSYPAEQCQQSGPDTVKLPPDVTAAVFPYVKNTADFSYAFNIRPSAIPKGATVLIQVTFNGSGLQDQGLDVETQVLANDLPPACTPQQS